MLDFEVVFSFEVLFLRSSTTPNETKLETPWVHDLWLVVGNRNNRANLNLAKLEFGRAWQLVSIFILAELLSIHRNIGKRITIYSPA